MQEQDNEQPQSPIQGEISPGSAMSAFGQVLEAFGSRRMLLGSMFGAMAGGLPFALARSAAAAPPEVRGSANIPIKVYNNTSGTYVLFADGSITRVDRNEAPTDPSRYAAVTHFQKRGQTANHAKGSPNVAVDILQDERGTYVLFADGTFRQPPGGAGTSGYGTVEYFYAKTYHGQVPRHSDNLIISGSRVRFKNPFREAPFTFAMWTQDRTNIPVFALPGEPGHNTATTTDWEIGTFNSSGKEGGFFGFGVH